MMTEVGQIGIADTSSFRDGYQVCRVVKPNKLGGMWTVEIYGRGWRGEKPDFSAPARRKVSVWHPITGGTAAEVHAALIAKSEAFAAARRELGLQYHADIEALAFRAATGEA